MSTVRLRGIAHRERPGVCGLDPASIVPAAVPVYVEYDYSKAVGTAALHRDEADTIRADITAEDGPWRETCRYLGMSFRVAHLADVPGAGLGEAIGVSLTASVLDKDKPPFEIPGDERVPA